MPEPQISDNDTIQRSPDLIASSIGEDTVLLSLQQNDYFGMNAVGSRIWEMLESPKPVTEICRVLQEEFSVSREECESDVLAFLNQMATDGLIKITDGTGG